MLSHGVVEDAEHMNAQARMCACQLRLHFFSGCESLPQVIHRNGVKWWPYAQAVLIPSVPKPSAAQVLVAYGSPSHPPGPVTDPDPLGPPPPVRPVLGAGLRSWLLGSGVVPVPLLVNTWYIVSSSTGAQQAPFFFVCLICQFYEQ